MYSIYEKCDGLFASNQFVLFMLIFTWWLHCTYKKKMQFISLGTNPSSKYFLIEKEIDMHLRTYFMNITDCLYKHNLEQTDDDDSWGRSKQFCYGKFLFYENRSIDICDSIRVRDYLRIVSYTKLELSFIDCTKETW